MTKPELMPVKSLLSGISNIHLIQAGDGVIAVDAGSIKRGARKLAGALEGLGLRPDQVKLLVLTHVHYDHVMAAAQIQQMCGCPVAVHAAEAPRMSAGIMEVPPGVNWWGKTVAWLGRSALGRAVVPKIMGHEPVEAQIKVDAEMSLASYGLAGRIVPTPGHSPGSMSVILDSGQAFVGDVIFNAYPFSLGPIMPPFAHDIPRLMQTWHWLLSSGVELIYPGHGKAIASEVLSRAYLKYADPMGGA